MNQCDECEQGKAANNTVAPPPLFVSRAGQLRRHVALVRLAASTRRSAQVVLQPAGGLMGGAACAARLTARAVRRALVMRIDLLYSCSFRSNIRAISSMAYDLMSR